MFGFGARKKFNERVSSILANDFQVEVDQRINPRFPGPLKYLEMIDEVWVNKGSPEAAAARVALPYYGGLAKSGNDTDRRDAEMLLGQIQRLLPSYLAKGLMAQDRFDTYSKVLEKHTRKRL